MISEEKLISKINNLPPGKIDEVVDFIDFLATKESSRRISERFSLIAAYATENAGSEIDLDEVFEEAGVQHLLAIDETPQ